MVVLILMSLQRAVLRCQHEIEYGDSSKVGSVLLIDGMMLTTLIVYLVPSTNSSLMLPTRRGSIKVPSSGLGQNSQRRG